MGGKTIRILRHTMSLCDVYQVFSTGELDHYVRDGLGAARSPRRSPGGFAVSVPVPSLESVSSSSAPAEQGRNERSAYASCGKRAARANGTCETKHLNVTIVVCPSLYHFGAGATKSLHVKGAWWVRVD